MLSSEQVEAYRRSGFLQVPGLCSSAILESSRARAERYMEAGESHAIFRYGADGKRIHCKLPQLAERDEVFRELAQLSAVSAIVEELLGPARIFRDVVIVKPPIAGAVVHYHQDAAYWDVDRPELALSAWIALDDAPAEAGCLQVVAGSHDRDRPHTLLMGGKRLPAPLTAFLRRAASLTGTGDNPRTLRERAFAGAKSLLLGSATRLFPSWNDLNDLRLEPTTVSPDSLTALPARAGDVVFFSSRLVHGSGANTSPNLRRAYIVSYMSARCRVPGREISSFLPARARPSASHTPASL